MSDENQTLDQIYDPLDDDTDIDPYSIYNPLDAFDGLDYLPMSSPDDDCHYDTTNKLADMLKTIRSRTVKKMMSGEVPRYKPELYELEKQEFHKTAGSEKYYQPLVLSCYFYLSLPTVKKPEGIGHFVQDIIDIMTGEEPVPEELKDLGHPAYEMTESIIKFFPSYWFSDNLRSGTLSKFRKSISEMLEHYPTWDTFSRFQIMGLQSLPRFYDLEDLPRERIFDGAVDVFGKFGTFDPNEAKPAERKKMTLTLLENTQFKEKNCLWFATENNERVYLQSVSKDKLQFLFINQLARSNINVKFRLENVTLMVKEEWCPYRLVVGRIVNYENLQIIKE